MSKKTLVIGASTNPERYGFKASVRLMEEGHEVIPFGIRAGEINGVNIEQEKKDFTEIDTITLYVGPKRQVDYVDYIISLNPKRIIFNPGTENPDLYSKYQSNGIQTEEACTLVLLSTGAY